MLALYLAMAIPMFELPFKDQLKTLFLSSLFLKDHPSHNNLLKLISQLSLKYHRQRARKTRAC